MGRGLQFLKLASQLGGAEIKKRLSTTGDIKTQLDQAKLLVESLGRLKGAAMKVGQLLSVEARDLLPPEVIAILGQLQDRAPPVGYSVMKGVLQSELGEKLSELSQFNEVAIASASMGQVYRARLGPNDVAIKVQYPGINESVVSDLAVLRTLTSTFLKLGGRQVDIDPLFEELKLILESEADYQVECQNLKAYREFFLSDSNFVVPKVFDDFCTKRVLCMSFEQGLTLDAFLATHPSLETRNKFGRCALDAYTREFFEAGLVQTDPNFGNFLFRLDPEQLVLLDLGAVKRYSPEFRKDYRHLLKVMREGSTQDLLDVAVDQMNLLKPGESNECLLAFADMLKTSIEPFNPSRQPFNFADQDYSNEVRSKAAAFTKLVRKSAPPHQIIFLHRKLGGVFALLRSLKVSIDLEPYWDRAV
jgi:aarF domain-containing kinase